MNITRESINKILNTYKLYNKVTDIAFINYHQIQSLSQQYAVTVFNFKYTDNNKVLHTLEVKTHIRKNEVESIFIAINEKSNQIALTKEQIIFRNEIKNQIALTKEQIIFRNEIKDEMLKIYKNEPLIKKLLELLNNNTFLSKTVEIIYIKIKNNGFEFKVKTNNGTELIHNIDINNNYNEELLNILINYVE